MITSLTFALALQATPAPVVGDPFREAVPARSDQEYTALIERHGDLCHDIADKAALAQGLSNDAGQLLDDLQRNERDNPPAQDAMGRVMARISGSMIARETMMKANWDDVGETLRRTSDYFCAATNRP